MTMAQHVDILEDSEPLKKSFVGSLLFHGLLVASVSGYTILKTGGPTLGSPTPARGGSVAITPVATIPLPHNNAPDNPLAKETKSNLPPPVPVKKQPQPRPKERPKP